VPSVSYTLLIDGSPAPPEVLATVLHLEVEDHAEMADMLRMRVLIGVRESAAGWALLDDELFSRLTNLRVLVNVGSGPVDPLIDAYVVETRSELSNTPGKSYLDIVAMDPTVLLSLDEKVRAWPNMSDSEVATTIFGEHGLEADVEATTVSYDEDSTTTMQRGTDMRLLTQLARRNGFEVFVEMDAASRRLIGHFHKPRVDSTPQGVLSVNLGEATNVNTFQARFDMMRPAQAQARSLDIESREGQEGQADSSSLKRLGKGATVDPDRPRRVLVSQTGLSQAGELQAYSQALVDQSSFAILAEGELSTAAYGSLLRAKRLVSVRGAGSQFSGTYYVKRVLHQFTGDGHLQKFSLRRNATGLAGQESFTEDRALPE
jgi:phage protein D